MKLLSSPRPLVLSLHLLPYGGGSASLGKRKPSNGNPFNFLPPDLHLISASVFPFFLPMAVEKGLLGSCFTKQEARSMTEALSKILYPAKSNNRI